MDSEINAKSTRHERCKRKSNDAEITKKAKVSRTRSSKPKSQVDDTGSNTKPTSVSNDVGVAATVTKEESEELKKIQYQYELDLTEMADRKTINVANLKDYIRDSFKNDGKIENLANTVSVEHDQWTIVVKSAMFFKKSALKYHSKKYLKMKKLRNYVQVVGNGNLNYRFIYYKNPQQ